MIRYPFFFPKGIAMRRTLLVIALSTLLLGACAKEQATEPDSSTSQAASVAAPANPLLMESWDTPFAAIPFDQIKFKHLAPALEAGISQQRAAISAIADSAEPATFANTLEALERANSRFRSGSAVYGVFTSNLSNDDVRKLETEYSAKFSQLQTETLLNPKLFARVKAVAADPATAALGAEPARLAEQVLDRFIRAGAALNDAERAQVAELTQRESALQTSFNQNLLRDTEAFKLALDEADLAGLPPSVRSGAAQAGTDSGQPGKYVFSLQRPSFEGFMTYSSRRDLREQLFNAFTNRGDNGNANDNNALIAELVKVRAERAKLLGFASHSHLVTAESMAKTPEAALGLLEKVWDAALVQTTADAKALQALIDQSGSKHPLEAWDWRYYAEQLRQQKFALDPAEVEPYFTLENMLNAAFSVSNRLFAINFVERKDIPVYHPDVRAFEVTDSAGKHIGLLYIDYFARQGKRSGAWMANYRPQQNFEGAVTPQVVNNLNVPKPKPGEPALVSMTETITLFHELGHGLHGLLSNVTYASLSGTSVPRDYVEFPAQFMEHYVMQPQVLKEFALHATTKEPISDELIERMRRADKFNRGFATIEFVASALVDQRFHALSPEQASQIDPDQFEREAMAELGALKQIPMRHRSPHFSHVFGGGYAAAYYAYMWSEVLDADGFAAFTETGDIFNPEMAKRLKDNVYSRGNTIDWTQGYVAFRGREPAVDSLLRNRGLLSDEQ